MIRLVPSEDRYIPSLHAALDTIARERRWLGLIEAPPLDDFRQFTQAILDGEGVQVLALDDSEVVVGWCDVVRFPREGWRHGGRLGMGILKEERGKGLGRALAHETIDRAWAFGLERIELDVYATNERAIALYQNLGFVVEGVKVRVRKLDGQYDDDIIMALLRPDVAH